MEINFFFEETDEFKINDKLDEWIQKSIENENKQTGTINVIFCSDNYLLKINKEYLNHDYYTDVITFDFCENNIVSGDVFISVDTVKKNATDYNVDFLNELYRVIIHGVLHLVSYNDKTEDEQKEMTLKENYYLAKLQV